MASSSLTRLNRAAPLPAPAPRRPIGQSHPTCRQPCRSPSHAQASRRVAPRATENAPLPIWEVMWELLMDKELKSLSPENAKASADSGEWVLIDVRPVEDFEKGHAQGAVSAPLFQSMDWGNVKPMGLLKAAALMVNGVAPVELNPGFVAQAKAACDGGKKGAILYCEAGGTMLPTTNFMRGKSSRSLKAAWILMEGGEVGKVAHLDGGLFGWNKAGMPMMGEYDDSNVGRTPNAAGPPSGEFIDKK